MRDGPLTSCADFDAFHGEDDLGAVAVPYIVGAACPGYDGPTVDDLQERTIAVSHELLEAATDPFPDSDPAYNGEDAADAVWTLATGGEIADLCQFDLDPYSTLPTLPTLPGSTSFVQRSWSNQAAAGGTNPCVPAPPGVPYFNWPRPIMPDTRLDRRRRPSSPQASSSPWEAAGPSPCACSATRPRPGRGP